jgi:hypothetical protein
MADSPQVRARALLRDAVGEEEFERYEETGDIRFPSSRYYNHSFHVTPNWRGIYELVDGKALYKRNVYVMGKDYEVTDGYLFEDRVVAFMLVEAHDPDHFSQFCLTTMAAPEAEQIENRRSA